MSLSSNTGVRFGDFELDEVNECVVGADRTIQLTPKAFEVLRYLVRRPGRLVTKQELLDGVWADVIVGDAVLKVAVHEIRKALGDRPSEPRYIETLHRRGYRLVAACSEVEAPPHAVADVLELAVRTTHPDLVGRTGDLEALGKAAARAAAGKRQVVFVAGEAGLGKTALVECFGGAFGGGTGPRWARGQCLEHYGPAESFLPVIDALAALCRGPGGSDVREALLRTAPTWLVQLPGSSGTDEEILQRATLGATRDRMLRELALVLEELTAERALVLVLEDLHWSDPSTVELISYLAKRREPARLLLLGTYRPVEVIVSRHPLRPAMQELRMHRLCEELGLELLTRSEVGHYLDRRFPDHRFPAQLASLLHRRTDGNPFFVVHVMDELCAQGICAEESGRWGLTTELAKVEIGVPDTIRQMIERQLDRLDEAEQRLLEAAAIAGMDFPADGVAAMTARDAFDVEDAFESLARRGQFVRDGGVVDLPDGSITARYVFRHSLYQTLLLERVPAARKIRWHLRFAERGIETYGSRTSEIATELAVHFERGRAPARAVPYLVQSARNATRRYANQEAVRGLERALDLADVLEHEERARLRRQIRTQLGLVHRSCGQMEEAAKLFEALADEAREENHADREVAALIYLASALSWVDRERCLSVCERARALGDSITDQLLRAHAEGYAGYWTLLLDGWSTESADAAAAAVAAARKAGNPAILCTHLIRLSYFECLRSQYRKGYELAQEGERLALEVADAFEYVLSRFYAAWALLHAGDWGRTFEILEDGIEMAQRNGHQGWGILFRIEKAWLHEQVGDGPRARELAEQGLADAREIGHAYGEMVGTILLGYVHLREGDVEAAGARFDESLRIMERGRVLMDWIWRIPAHHGLGEVLVARGELEEGRAAAERTVELAAVSGERHFMALAKRRQVLISMAQDDLDRADVEIADALALVEGGDIPLAAWRVHDAAAQLATLRGDPDRASGHRARAATLLDALAESVQNVPTLRDAFEKDEQVRRLRG